MWTRKDLKNKAKIRIKATYWKCVLAGLVLLIALGSNGIPNINYSSSSPFHLEDTKSHDDEKDDINIHFEADNPQELVDGINELANQMKENVDPKFFTIMGIVFFFVFAIVFVIVMVVKTFLLNPLSVGGYKFFYDNLNHDAELKELGVAFSTHYLNIIKTLFLRDIYILLWSLLLVIPGFIKAYEYAMVPYLLGNNPEMTTKEAFAQSKALMKGNKWKAFVLDLSFIGWNLLSACTCGILTIFYVGPYTFQTGAAFYEAISNEYYNRSTPVIESDYIEIE